MAKASTCAAYLASIPDALARASINSPLLRWFEINQPMINPSAVAIISNPMSSIVVIATPLTMLVNCRPPINPTDYGPQVIDTMVSTPVFSILMINSQGCP